MGNMAAPKKNPRRKKPSKPKGTPKAKPKAAAAAPSTPAAQPSDGKPQPKSNVDFAGLIKGRPPKWSDEAMAFAKDEVLRRYTLGGLENTITHMLGENREPHLPSITEFYRWLADDPAFRKAYASAREVRGDMEAEEVVSLSDKALTEGPEKTQAYRLAVDARKWRASRLNPEKWGDKVAIDHGGAIATRDMPDDQLNARLGSIIGAAVAAAQKATTPGKGDE